MRHVCAAGKQKQNATVITREYWVCHQMMTMSVTSMAVSERGRHSCQAPALAACWNTSTCLKPRPGRAAASAPHGAALLLVEAPSASEFRASAGSGGGSSAVVGPPCVCVHLYDAAHTHHAVVIWLVAIRGGGRFTTTKQRITAPCPRHHTPCQPRRVRECQTPCKDCKPASSGLELMLIQTRKLQMAWRR